MNHQASVEPARAGINKELHRTVKISYGLGDNERVIQDGLQSVSY